MITDLTPQVDYKELFQQSIAKFPNSKKWLNGCFCAIKTASNTGVGNIGEDFILEYSKALGFDAKISENRTSWDIEINGIKYELKTATEDVHGKFQFNHFRTHRAYDAAICLGVSPNELYVNVISKSELMEKPLVSMEKGANASYKWTRHPKELHKITSFNALIENFTSEFLEIKRLTEESRIKRDKIDLE